MKMIRSTTGGKSFRGRGWLTEYIVVFAITIAAGWAVTTFLGARVQREIFSKNRAAAVLLATHLSGDLGKMESVVKTLSGSPWLAPELIAPSPRNLARADATLGRYNNALHASVTYLMDKTGLTVASSNRNAPDSFVGKSYRFRPYFKEAMSGRAGHYFAVGITSLKRGFYASFPVFGPDNDIVGVVVMKSDPGHLQSILSSEPLCFFVSPSGIIFLSSRPNMRLKSLWPLQPDRARELVASRQFGKGPFSSVLPGEVRNGMQVRLQGKEYIVARAPVGPHGWSIVALAPLEETLIYQSVCVVSTVVVLLLLTIPFVLSRQAEKATETLRKSEEKYKTFFETSRDCVFITSTDGRWLDCNQAAVRLFGYDDMDELRRTKIPSLYENEADRHWHVATIQAKGFTQDYPVNLRKKDGAIINTLITSVPRKDQQGTVIGYQGIIKDVTKEKKLQERLFRAEKMEALGMLAGGVAHDLNNVLGILIGYSELLLMDVEESHPTRAHLLHIKQASERAAAIVQDLLTLARRNVPVVEVFNLNGVIEDYQRTLEYEKLPSTHPGIRVETRLAPDLLNIEGSPVHLGQTFMNLVSNGVEAMPRGGVLTITTENRYLDRPITGYDEVREGEYVVLSVSDTGKGIAPSDLKHIFEPFYTRKVMGKSGTGLGLSVVWGAVKDHHGYINVESREEEGTTFSLYFPISRKETSDKRASSSLQEYRGNGHTILVVDDVAEQRELARQMLSRLGYGVQTVSSGEEAIEYLKTHPVDLIVLDMIMESGMDGLDAYSRVLEIHPGQKAIIVSGFAETSRVQKALELGAGSYLKKPYVIEQLGMAVKKELDRSR
ncbi:MAG: hybrid sensor histidine kinase/response regulator [Syntrophobacteraceae bacterium]